MRKKGIKFTGASNVYPLERTASERFEVSFFQVICDEMRKTPLPEGLRYMRAYETGATENKNHELEFTGILEVG